MATRAQLITALNSIANYVLYDPGLKANITAADITAGANAAKLMNEVLADAIIKTGASNDGLITPAEVMRISDVIRADPAAYAKFLQGHGDDEGNIETGFHRVQGDGGTFQFKGRNFVDTIADAIYHIGFTYSDGRFVNEDGDQNERVADIAGWLNFFISGRTVVFGTNGADELYSGTYSAAFAAARNETYSAGAGNDNIWADLGDDIVYAGTGNDQSGGGGGNDKLYGEDGDDDLWGDDGDDIVSGGTGNDQIGGGAGNDNLKGDAGIDKIGGGTGNDTMYGGDGDDKLWGEDGADVILGGIGNDQIGGGSGIDTIYGEAGNDTIYGDDGNDILAGMVGNDILGGSAGHDYLAGGAGVDQLYGGDGADRLYGDAGNDEMYGDAGNDVLYGGTENDSIWGGDGYDTLVGSDGNDKLSGGNNGDYFWGGKGADELADWEDWNDSDRFMFMMGDSGVTTATRDVVLGFDSGIDKIDLHYITGLTFRPNQVTYSGGGKASAYFVGSILFVDGTGDAVTDMTIEFRWVDKLSVGDFLLA